jgi:hypothetical protein
MPPRRTRTILGSGDQHELVRGARLGEERNGDVQSRRVRSACGVGHGVERFMRAFEAGDLDTVSGLFAEDARLFGPVIPEPVHGRGHVGAVLWAARSRFDRVRYAGQLTGRAVARDGVRAFASRPAAATPSAARPVRRAVATSSCPAVMVPSASPRPCPEIDGELVPVVADLAGARDGHQLDIIERMGVPVLDQPAGADLVIDALLGYSLRGDPACKPNRAWWTTLRWRGAARKRNGSTNSFSICVTTWAAGGRIRPVPAAPRRQLPAGLHPRQSRQLGLQPGEASSRARRRNRRPFGYVIFKRAMPGAGARPGRGHGR